jgi:hypothetical protein
LRVRESSMCVMFVRCDVCSMCVTMVYVVLNNARYTVCHRTQTPCNSQREWVCMKLCRSVMSRPTDPPQQIPMYQWAPAVNQPSFSPVFNMADKAFKFLVWVCDELSSDLGYRYHDATYNLQRLFVREKRCFGGFLNCSSVRQYKILICWSCNRSLMYWSMLTYGFCRLWMLC